MRNLLGLVVGGVLVGVVAIGILGLAVVAALYGAYYGVRALWRMYQANKARRADAYARVMHQHAQIAARAELQHRWYLDGDPRGTYGRYFPAI